LKKLIPIEDAYGQMIWTYYKRALRGQRSQQICERFSKLAVRLSLTNMGFYCSGEPKRTEVEISADMANRIGNVLIDMAKC